MAKSDIELKTLWDKVSHLEERLDSIEKSIKAGVEIETPVSESAVLSRETIETKEKENIEMRIGEFGLPRIGLAILTIGVFFLVALPFKSLPQYLPPLLGYFLATAFLGVSVYLRKYREKLAIHIVASAIAIIYLATMRFHYFTHNPTISTNSIEMILLGIIVVFSTLYAIRVHSRYLIMTNIVLAYITVVLTDEAYVFFFVLLFSALFIQYFSKKNQWTGVPLFTLLMTYMLHLNWFLNNPLYGNPIQIQQNMAINIVFVILYMILFSVGNLLRQDENEETSVFILSSFLNASAGYLLILIISFLSLKEIFALTQIITAALLLALSIYYWKKTMSVYATFFYAMTAYTALTAAIIYYFDSPDFFAYLALQSLVVIITAILFHSRFIIVSNFIIFCLLFITSIFIASDYSLIILGFGIVGLISARILNWQKDRLTLKTDLMRNAYLIVSMVAFPYGAAVGLPKEYISLSWGGIVILYFILASVLEIKKYRIMAMFTLGLIILRIFIVDTVAYEPVIRVITFIILALVILALSYIYTRIKKRDKQ